MHALLANLPVGLHDLSQFSFTQWVNCIKKHESGIRNTRIRIEFQSRTTLQSSLHDSESIFHSGSSVQSGMKNGMNSIRNELQLNPDSCKQI